MNRIDLLRSAGFRYFLLYAGLFGGSVVVLCCLIFWTTTRFLSRQFDTSIRMEAATLRDVAEAGGRAALLTAVAGRLAAASGRWNDVYYLVADDAGRVIMGNLAAGPAPRPGRTERPTPLPVEDADDHIIRIQTIALPGGLRLSVGRDSYVIGETREILLRAFAGAGVVTVLLSALGGLLMSRALLGRLDVINRTCREIVAGGLLHRAPLRGSGDEFDQLAINLNVMLDRIETLMDGLRQVSNDIAHDLRSPLARMRQGLEAARRGASGTADYEAAIDRALGEADGLLHTFESLLRIAQIEAGACVGAVAELDLSELVLAVVETYGPVAEDRGQRLRGEVAPGLTMWADKALMTQMLVNLVENALKHGPAGIDVALTLERHDGGARLVVADGGPGIPPAERAKVFRRFYRLDRSRTTPGNGLGFSLVAAVAGMHGAQVELGDAGPGLRVTLTFPPSPRAVARS